MSESVRERLERMQNSPRRVAPPLSRDEINPRLEKVLLSPESVFIRKIEKVMKRIECLKKKMNSDSGQYLSLYYDLKKAEIEFLELINHPEVQYLDLSDIFMSKAKALKKEIENKKD
tara:strand:- start:723 stop:1073 length:351 start_codon:yes stop_codon:yes gene_type:complete